MRADATNVNVSVDVDHHRTEQPSLPHTGLDAGSLLAAGALLVVVGMLAVVATRLRPKGMTMIRFRPIAVLSGLALLVAVAVPAGAAEVTVSVANPGGSRTLYVENLTGTALTTLDFGTDRTLPFRVRVVDEGMDRSAFSVNATMTNLYADAGSAIDYGTKITSSNLSIGSAANAVNALNLSAQVRPLVDTVSTITDPVICAVLGVVQTVVGGVLACRINTTGLAGLPQTLPVPVNLADLTNLPLLPQAPEAGAFTNPDFAGVGAADPARPSSFVPTPRRLMGGAPISTAAVLTALQGLLDTNPRSDLIADLTIVNGVGAAVGPAWAALSAAQVTSILGSTVATVESLLPAQVLAQTGTYFSFPTLSVNVPADAAKGSYKGTLVVTALQP
ncbi:MAG TPA: hypothetical protein VM030_08375 [Acidimicrobiales bacterium]|nr:hypothetical protein [Acidimicrobiales bacterium]